MLVAVSPKEWGKQDTFQEQECIVVRLSADFNQFVKGEYKLICERL